MTPPDLPARARAVVEAFHVAAQSDVPCLTGFTEQHKRRLADAVATFAAAEVQAVENPKACQDCEGEDCERCGGTGFYCVSCATYGRAADMWQALLAEARAQAAAAAERERDEAREHLNANCLQRDALMLQLAAAQRALEKWREYAEFLNRANEGPIRLAHVHGWRCPQADIDEGKRRRAELDSAAPAPAPGRPPQEAP